MIINLISSPRNISTAFMYSFAQREDTTVVDEPFYAYYLQKTGIWHPGREETLASMPSELPLVLEGIQQQAQTAEVLFLKNMAHHLIEMDVSFLTKMTNLFLIRNPKQLIASFAQVIEHPTMQDIGAKRQQELYQYLLDSGQKAIVLDSGELLKNPEKVVRQTCEALGISFSLNMLQWKAGARPEDGAWATHWYKNVHASTGFQKQKTSERTLPAHCTALYEAAKPYYDTLFEQSIKA